MHNHGLIFKRKEKIMHELKKIHFKGIAPLNDENRGMKMVRKLEEGGFLKIDKVIADIRNLRFKTERYEAILLVPEENIAYVKNQLKIKENKNKK